MLYRASAALILLAILPTIGRSESLTLEMITALAIAPKTTFSPSSNSFLFDLKVGRNKQLFLPNVLYQEFHAANYVRDGVANLNFRLTLGSEIVSQTATFDYHVYNQFTGVGAIGANSYVTLASPAIFDTDKGRFTLYYAAANTNLLGDAIGATDTEDLSVHLRYTPEPNSFTLLCLGVAIVSCLRRRNAYPPISALIGQCPTPFR